MRVSPPSRAYRASGTVGLVALAGLAAGACLGAGAGCESLPPMPRELVRAATTDCGTTARPWGTPGCESPPFVRAHAAVDPPGPATVLQVEVSGRVALPEGAPAGRTLLALTDGPCFQPGTHYVGVTRPAPDGSYQLTVFPPVGTHLEACGALVEPLRSGVSFWGRADRGTMEVQGRGKMVLSGTDVPLRRSPEVVLPTTLLSTSAGQAPERR